MALFLQYRTDRVQWAVWEMSESLETLLTLLPDAQRVFCMQELQRFTSNHRKMEWLAVRVLLFSILREDKQISYSSDGKPSLTDNSAFISISHTKGYVAVALSPVASVGIDIEQYGQRVHRVYDRFIRPDERIEPYQGDTTWSMILHWSAKEAIYKCMNPADADFRKIRLSHFIPQKEGSFPAQAFGTEREQTFLIDYQIHPDFVLIWVMNGIKS